MYNYEREKPEIFTDQGQRMFLQIRDNVKACLAKSGAVSMGAAIRNAGSGSSWTMLACVDRLVELEEIRGVPQSNVAGQHRIFVDWYRE